MRGAGFDKVDLRIHAIDPLSRDFWPFPADGVSTDDATEPPLPGNAPAKWSDDKDVDAAAITARINALGSAAVSELAALPIQRGGAGAKFGLDLKSYFAKIKGPDQPGAYLVGMRPVTGSKRNWMRVQVTDLTLTAVEEADRVRFFVTSLSDAKLVEGAEIRLEGLRDEKFATLIDGRTDAEGAFTWMSANRRRPRSSGSSSPKASTRWCWSQATGQPNMRGRTGPSPMRHGSPGRSAPPSCARRRRERSAISSRSGRSIAPKSRYISKDMCGAIRAARSATPRAAERSS